MAALVLTGTHAQAWNDYLARLRVGQLPEHVAWHRKHERQRRRRAERATGRVRARHEKKAVAHRTKAEFLEVALAAFEEAGCPAAHPASRHVSLREGP